ncbi:MAG: hypothetical protein R3E77_11430 [Steroidobacteraceae bacterium]
MPPAGLPIEFLLFGATLLAVALWHDHSLTAALLGLLVITLYKILITGFGAATGLAGLGHHLAHEWVTLANLFGLLVGFALIARHFELSELPRKLPHYLPDNWTGGLWLLFGIFVISSFLDNIAAALIGGALAHSVYRGRVRIGYLAAIVAAANAGGAGSVIGDTTTTMIWIHGKAPSEVFHAYIGAIAALLVCGIPAALAQQRHAPIMADTPKDTRVDLPRILIVLLVLALAVAANVIANTHQPQLLERLPLLGAVVSGSLLLSVPLRRPDWTVLPSALRSALFLLALVTAASMMPVERLPTPTWHSTAGIGIVSALFDNIPLTALALRQGGYDWGVLAYAVGFGGSMIWFGSSAGVAVTALYPEARSARRWLREGWYVALSYVAGFAALLLLAGWRPD